jgi:hypothetical protein
VGGDLRHGLFQVQGVAGIDDGQAGNGAHHRQVFGGLVAGAVAGGQAGQGAADLDVQVFFGDHLVDEVVGAPRAEDRIGGGEGHQAFLGHAAGGGHQQLLGHAHLEEALGVGLGWNRCRSVFGQVGGQAHDLGPVGGQLHQALPKGAACTRWPSAAMEAIMAEVVRRGFFSATVFMLFPC